MQDAETKSLVVAPGPRKLTVQTQDGVILEVPEGWGLLPPGDAGLTRRVKAGGPSWTVKEQKGRRAFSRGVWAPKSRIDRLQGALEAERGTSAYKAKQASAKTRRDKAQSAYVLEFTRHVEAFLNFADVHAAVAREMATAIAVHATPVGSGTVARTSRIPVAERAEAATIAWLRHQTTAYDRMHIPRVKGRRKEVRRALAKRSRELLARYRDGSVAEDSCPLLAALKQVETQNAPTTGVPKPATRPKPAARAKPAVRPAARERTAKQRRTGSNKGSAAKPDEPRQTASSETTPAIKPLPQAPVVVNEASRPVPAPGQTREQDSRMSQQARVRERLQRRRNK